MSASGQAPGGLPDGGYLPVVGWYPDPAGHELQRWWDGQAWTTRTQWPWSPLAPPPSRLAVWLASPAGSLLLLAVAAATALGWVAGAALIAVTVVAGQPMTAVMSVLSASVFPVLPVLDLAAAVFSLAVRSGQRTPEPPGGSARAMRKAARGRMPVRARALWAIRGAARRIRGAFLFSSLPRPVSRAYAAAMLSILAGYAWLLAWSLPHGGIDFGDPHGSSVLSQQFAAMTWMAHLVGWCGVACVQLNRGRAAARV